MHNPSFEAPALADGAYQFSVTQAQQGGRGWDIGIGAFAYNPAAGDFAGAAGSGTPQGADGAQVAGVFGFGNYAVFQTLAGTDGIPGNSDDPVVEVGTVYTLTFSVGQRADADPLGTTYGGYDVELLAGTVNNLTVLGRETNAVTPAPGTFVTRTIVMECPTYDYPEAIGQPLTIRLRKTIINATATIDFDNIRLDAVKVSPELNADFTENGVVNGDDLAAWRSHHGSIRTAATHERGNANSDDVVDGHDLLLWQRQLGNNIGVASVAVPVPEPAAGALVAAFVLGAAPFRSSGRRSPSPVRECHSPG